VEEVVSGYSGSVKNPYYEYVSSNRRHAESVAVFYDPK
jgi:peptide methionine sulfoxide reductase MsrA